MCTNRPVHSRLLFDILGLICCIHLVFLPYEGSEAATVTMASDSYLRTLPSLNWKFRIQEISPVHFFRLRNGEPVLGHVTGAGEARGQSEGSEAATATMASDSCQ